MPLVQTGGVAMSLNTELRVAIELKDLPTTASP